MSKVKRRLFFNYEKEERWLNEMAQKGYHLIKYSIGKYTFEEGEPGAYIYRLQYLDNKSEVENKEYLELMEDGGIEVIDVVASWAFFRKKAEEGPFMIFSDKPSRIKHYYTIIQTLGFIAGLNLFLWILNFTIIGNQFNKYMSSINILAAIILVIVIVHYLKQIRKLNRQDEL